MTIDGHELRDLKRLLMTSKSLEFRLQNGHQILIIEDEFLKTKTYVGVKFSKTPKKDIA